MPPLAGDELACGKFGGWYPRTNGGLTAQARRVVPADKCRAHCASPAAATADGKTRRKNKPAAGCLSYQATACHCEERSPRIATWQSLQNGRWLQRTGDNKGYRLFIMGSRFLPCSSPSKQLPRRRISACGNSLPAGDKGKFKMYNTRAPASKTADAFLHHDRAQQSEKPFAPIQPHHKEAQPCGSSPSPARPDPASRP